MEPLCVSVAAITSLYLLVSLRKPAVTARSYVTIFYFLWTSIYMARHLLDLPKLPSISASYHIFCLFYLFGNVENYLNTPVYVFLQHILSISAYSIIEFPYLALIDIPELYENIYLNTLCRVAYPFWLSIYLSDISFAISTLIGVNNALAVLKILF